MKKRKRLIFQINLLGRKVDAEINLPKCIGLSPGWLWADDSPFGCLSDRRRAAPHTEFLEDVDGMGLDGARFDVEVFGDLFIGRSFGHQLQDLHLPWRERSLRGLSAGELEQAVQYPVGHLGIYHRGNPISSMNAHQFFESLYYCQKSPPFLCVTILLLTVAYVDSLEEPSRG